MAEEFDLSSLLGEFRDEARDQLERLDSALLRIEEEGALPADDTTPLLRSLHTLKGNSGMLGLRPVTEAVHALEEVFKETRAHFPRERLDLLFQAAAALRQAVEAAGSPGEGEAFERLRGLRLEHRLEPGLASAAPSAQEAPPAAPPEPESPAGPTAAPPPAADAPASGEPSQSAGAGAPADADSGEGAGEFLRVPFAKLDQLLDEVGELTSVSATLRALLESFEDELEQSGAARALDDVSEQLVRVTRALRVSTMEVRLVPVQRVFSRFPSLVRDLAREQGKRVRVILEGGDVELDRSMVDALGDPLLHLVRNAVDHGIRNPEEREAAGLPATGTIVLRAYRQGDRVRVEVQDDGAGLDMDALRRAGRERGLVGPHSPLSAAETAELIFLPGFSTRTSSDTVSGRGIGLDAVKQRVTALRGNLAVESPPEGGTRFALDLPLTLAILPALVFEATGATFALPAVSVERTLRGAVPERAGAAEVLRDHDELIPVARPARLFEWDGPDGADAAGGAPFAVVVRAGTRRAAVLADRLVEQRDLVVKALPGYVGRVPAVSGASIAPDGRVILLLDPAGVLDLNLALHQREKRAFTPQ